MVRWYGKNMANTKLVKMGNSYGVIIPRSFLSVAGWQRGDELKLQMNTTESLVWIEISKLPVIT